MKNENKIYPKEYLNLIKKEIFLVKKREIYVIITMIILTRSSERIFNPSGCTGHNFQIYIRIYYIAYIIFQIERYIFFIHKNPFLGEK